MDTGWYSVVATDENGCADSASYYVPRASWEEISFINIVAPVCSSLTSGSLEVVLYDESLMSYYTGPIELLWSNGDTSAVASNLGFGTHTVTIVDGTNGASCAYNYSWSYPSISLNVAQTSNSCFGESSGALTVNSASGAGGGPYSFLWSTGDTVDNITDLAAGSYSLTVSNASGCSDSYQFQITEPEPLEFSFSSYDPIVCAGDSTQLTVSASGGSGQYLLMSDSIYYSSSMNFSLVNGTYTFVLFDNADLGCQPFVDSINILGPDFIQVDLVSLNDLDCSGDLDGSIDINVIGGTGSYSYSWSDGAITQDRFNLSGGQYFLTVVDANDCEVEVDFEIQEPELIESSLFQADAVCFGDSNGGIQTQVTGGISPYNFSWNHGAIGSILTNLSPGVYVLTITDANGCELVDSAEIGYSFSLPAVDLGEDQGVCEGETIVIQAPVAGSYIWSNNSTSSFLEVSSAGTYWLAVTDVNGCSGSDTIEVETYSNPVVSLGADTTICQAHLEEGFVLEGPSGMESYLWSTNGSDSVQLVTEFGTYWLFVVDAFGCTGADTIAVLNDTCLGVNAFQPVTDWYLYPNPARDQVNLHVGNLHQHVGYMIYTVAGQLVANGTVMAEREVINVSMLQSGIYVIDILVDGQSAHRARMVIE